MSQNQHFSDEFLNAFVDDQLSGDDKSRAYLEIGQDETLNRQVCELRKLRDLVQHAYRDLPEPPATTGTPARRRGRTRFGIAACLTLAFGAVLGLQIDAPHVTGAVTGRGPAPAPAATAVSRVTPTPAPRAVREPAARIAATVAPVAAPATAVATEARNRVIIHIADDKPGHLEQALTDIESLLHYYRDNHESARVQVVLNGRGLEMVRADTSAFAERIARLQREFDNLTFAACQNTIDRLRTEDGVAIRLLPGVTVIDSGVAEIMRRQSQGWTYLQV